MGAPFLVFKIRGIPIMKRNKFLQHIPNWCDGLVAQSFHFNTTEELLNNPLVAGYRKDPSDFFAISENTLMIISDQGCYWWVVGYIKHPNELDLPKWLGGKYRVVLNGVPQIVEKVRSSCGDVLELSDGTKTTRISKEDYEEMLALNT